MLVVAWAVRLTESPTESPAARSAAKVTESLSHPFDVRSPSLLRHSKPEHRSRAIRLARTEDHRGEVWLVRGIRVVLGLECEPVTMAVHSTAFPDGRAVEEVSAVELHARLGGVDVERASRGRLRDPRGMCETGAGGTGEHEVVVVAAPVTELDVRVVDARTDCRRSSEVE